jgi:hypothetical protein
MERYWYYLNDSFERSINRFSFGCSVSTGGIELKKGSKSE